MCDRPVWYQVCRVFFLAREFVFTVFVCVVFFSTSHVSVFVYQKPAKQPFFVITGSFHECSGMSYYKDLLY